MEEEKEKRIGKERKNKETQCKTIHAHLLSFLIPRRRRH